MLKKLVIVVTLMALVVPLSFAKGQGKKNKGVENKKQETKYSYLYDTSLIQAIKKQDTDRVKFLLLALVNPNEPNDEGYTPLVIAANMPSSEILTLLLDAEANPNLQLGNGVTPMISAAAAGRIENLRLLIKYGANPNLADDTGTTPLIAATKNKQQEAVDYLLSLENININHQDKTGESAVFYSVKNKDPEMTHTLVFVGADATLTDKNKKTPLDYASENEDQDTIAVLTSNLTKAGYIIPEQEQEVLAKSEDQLRLEREQVLEFYNQPIDFTTWDKDELEVYIEATGKNLKTAKEHLRALNLQNKDLKEKDVKRSKAVRTEVKK